MRTCAAPARGLGPCTRANGCEKDLVFSSRYGEARPGMKTFIATLVLSFVTVAMFTGCSSETSTPSESDVPSEAPAAPEAPEAPGQKGPPVRGISAGDTSVADTRA